MQSSANKMNSDTIDRYGLEFTMSLTNIRNNSGPSMEPCGSPCDVCKIKEELVLY